MTLSIQVRLLAKHELEPVENSLDQDWGNSQKHRERLERQGRDKLAYLVAWIEGTPLGHAALKWDGASDKAVAGRVSQCPDVEDLFVHPERRSEGIGTEILREAEALARARGDQTVGLGVGIDNLRARKLYESLGYQDAGVGEYLDRWQYVDRSGRKRWEEQRCCYLTKPLV